MTHATCEKCARSVGKVNVMGNILMIMIKGYLGVVGGSKGLIADASDGAAVMINLGSRHGVRVGQTYNALEEGEPVEVGGRVIAHRQKPVGKIKVTSVEEDFALCETLNLRDGASLSKEMKIQMTH